MSRWYRNDWQYAVDVSRIPLLRPAAFIISLTPTVISVSETLLPSLLGTIPVTLWLLWGASVAFVLAWAVLYLACLKFIREYRDFGQYVHRQHSHRWIVWEFYHNLDSLRGWQGIVRETLPKGLTTEVQHLDAGAVSNFGAEFSALPINEVRAFRPVNVGRDIYLPIHCDDKKLVLAMYEDDPKLTQKEKELFWILYSQAAKERPVWRTIYWVLITISVLLMSANVIRKIYLVVASGFAS